MLTPVSLGSAQNACTNNMQKQSAAFLWRFDDSLYALSRFPLNGYDESAILSIDGSSVRKVYSLKKHDSLRVIGATGGWIYYAARNHDTDELYCFDCASETENLVYSGQLGNRNTMFFDEDGSLYYPLKETKSAPENLFLHISGNRIEGITTFNGEYPVGDCIYSAKYNFGNAEDIYRAQDGNTSRIELPFGLRRQLIPFKDGLLIYNERSENLLYSINPEGALTEVFHIPCLDCRSAICIVEDAAYLSFQRYEKYGEIGMRGFDNDTFQGTYRIDLTDFTFTKISDQIFDGLFYLDDGGLYAVTTESNWGTRTQIYRLDFDGNTTLLSN